MLESIIAAWEALPPAIRSLALAKAICALPQDAQLSALRQLRELIDITPALKEKLA